MSEWTWYRRKGYMRMRPYIAGEDLSGVSVPPGVDPAIDRGMIAQSPIDPQDIWYVNRQIFDENYEEA